MRTETGNEGTDTLKELRCSFCERSLEECNHLIQGPGIYICDRCVGVCVYVLKNKKKSEVTGMTPLKHKEGNPYAQDE